jgi:hypothetical protein
MNSWELLYQNALDQNFELMQKLHERETELKETHERYRGAIDSIKKYWQVKQKEIVDNINDRLLGTYSDLILERAADAIEDEVSEFSSFLEKF